MINKKKTVLLSILGVSMTLAGCVTNPETGKKSISKTAIGGFGGALGGYLLGDLIGGRNDRTEKIIGAGIGGLAGAGIGRYMDNQEKKLREQTAGTGVNVVRDGDNLILDIPSEVTFAVDSSTVNPQFGATLDQVSATLSEFEQTYIDVLGHTDSTGSDSYNQALSERRASSVANYLSNRGVNSARLATRGFGESQPRATNVTEEGRALNRRVEIRLVPVTEGA